METLQPAMQVYTLVQIPASLGVSHEIAASCIKEVRAWALNNIDTTTRWIIKQNGRNLGEAIVMEFWRVCRLDGKAKKKTFNHTARTTWFLTKRDAEADYSQHKKPAELRLDEIESKIRELQKSLKFNIDYHMAGDTHGIYEDYQYISVTEGGYSFAREIN